jgi:uncharacterized delta-60 repeat protein
MIGKFINPIVSSSAPPTPSADGIYITSSSQSIVSATDTEYFHNVGILNSDLTKDTSFNIGSNGGFYATGSFDTAFTTSSINNGAQQADGKIVLIGSFAFFEGQAVGRIIRLNLDGTIDTSFNSGGTGFASGSFITSIKIQTDGKIILAGSFNTYNGTSVGRIIRLNSDGSIDTGFTIGTGPNNTVQTVDIQSDGKILIGGTFTSYNGVTINRLARLNVDGTLDTSFNIGTGFDNSVNDVKISTLGIYVCGSFTSFNGASGTVISNLIRLNSNGTRDTGFAKSFNTGTETRSICVLPDNSVVIGGTFSTNNSGNILVGLARYNSNGTTFSNFRTVGNHIAGSGSSGVVKVIYIASDNSLLVCGPFQKFGYKFPSRYFAKVNIDGSDPTTPPSFGFINFKGVGTGNIINNIVELSGGKILLMGNFLISSTSNFNSKPNDIYNLVKIQGSNSFTTLNLKSTQIGASSVYGFYLDHLNNIYIYGEIAYTPEGAYSYRRILKFDNQGNLLYDDPINLNNVMEDNIAYVSNITRLSDGNFLVIGQFKAAFGNYVNAIVKISESGVFLSTPGASNISVGSSTVIKEDSDGKVYVGGVFFSMSFVGGASSYTALFRLNSNMTIDNSLAFNLSNSSTIANTSVVDMAIQSDGKIIIIGGFDRYSSTSRRYIARLNYDGSLDTTFDVGTGFFTTASSSSTDSLSTSSMILQNDGKVIVCGRFISYNGFSSRGIIRLNSDGSVDTTFNVGTGFDLKVDRIYMTSDGKIHAVGDFRSYNGNPAVSYCVLNSDGSFHSAPYRFTLQVNSIFIKE